MSLSPSKVAPLAGARIEISHRIPQIDMIGVAPLAGARIEIIWLCMLINSLYVAPLAGARIEINPSGYPHCTV